MFAKSKEEKKEGKQNKNKGYFFQVDKPEMIKKKKECFLKKLVDKAKHFTNRS